MLQICNILTVYYLVASGLTNHACNPHAHCTAYILTCVDDTLPRLPEVYLMLTYTGHLRIPDPQWKSSVKNNSGVFI